MYDHLKFQSQRKNPHKPSVVNVYGAWWAQVHDLDGELRHEFYWSQSEALSKAYEYAHMVHKQRIIKALAEASEPTA